MSRGLDWLVIALPEGEAATARVEHLIGETRLHAPSLVERYRDTRLVVLSADPVTVMRCGADERLILLGSVRVRKAGGGGQAAAGGVLPNGDGLQDLGAPESGSHQTGRRDAACGPPLVARLLERRWGAYIAIWTERGDGRLMVDPSGSQPAVIMRRGPLTLAAADLPRWI